MTFVLQKKSGLFVPSGKVDHLFIILTDKDRYNRHFWVNISTIPKDGGFYDKSCVLKPGCHKFVTDPSFVFYALAGTANHEQILKYLATKYYRPSEPASDDMFKQICDGIEKSRAARWFKKDYVAAIRAGL